MFGRVTMTCFSAVAALTLAAAKPASGVQPMQPAHTVALTAAAPASSLLTAPLSHASAQVRLGAAEMGRVQGDGWFRKFWNRYKSVIIKIVEAIVQYLKDTKPTTTTSSAVFDASLSQDVTETYDAEDVSQTTYASQSDYNTGNVQSQSSYGTDYSLTGVSYGGGLGDGPMNRDMAY
jgi:hypothetical protein